MQSELQMKGGWLITPAPTQDPPVPEEGIATTFPWSPPTGGSNHLLLPAPAVLFLDLGRAFLFYPTAQDRPACLQQQRPVSGAARPSPVPPRECVSHARGSSDPLASPVPAFTSSQVRRGISSWCHPGVPRAPSLHTQQGGSVAEGSEATT